MSKKHIILILLTAFTLQFSLAKEHKHVLILHSYFPAQGWAYEANLGLRTAFQEQSNLYITLDIRYLDLRSEINSEKVNRLREEIRQSYGDGTNIDLIMAIDDYAWDFINEKNNVLYEEIPAIFCSAKNYHNAIAPNRQYTGLNESLSFEENIELIKEIRPNTDEVLFLCSENLPTGRGHLKEMDKLPSTINGVKITIWRDSTSYSLKKELARLSHNAVIFYGITKFTDDPVLDMEINLHNWQFFRQYAGVPTFTHNYDLLGKGVLGGYMIKAYDTGYEAAKMAIQYLNGKPLHLMPVKLMKSRYLGINYKVARQFKIAESQIPKNADIIDFEPSFWVKNRAVLFIILLVFIVLIGVIVLLLERRNEYKKRIRMQSKRITDVEDYRRMNKASFNLIHKELQLPFSSISGLNKMLRDPKATKDEKVQYLNLINENVSQIVHLHAEYGQILSDTPESSDIVSRSFQTHHVLKEVYEYALDLRNEKKLTDLTISLNLTNDMDKTLVSDPLRLKQQLILILHFLFDKSTDGVIELGTQTTEASVIFYLKENGYLLSDEDIKKHQEQSLKETAPVNDLSYIIRKVQNLCKKMNNDFRINNLNNKSLTFSIELPNIDVKSKS